MNLHICRPLNTITVAMTAAMIVDETTTMDLHCRQAFPSRRRIFLCMQSSVRERETNIEVGWNNLPTICWRLSTYHSLTTIDCKENDGTTFRLGKSGKKWQLAFRHPWLPPSSQTFGHSSSWIDDGLLRESQKKFIVEKTESFLILSIGYSFHLSRMIFTPFNVLRVANQVANKHDMEL